MTELTFEEQEKVSEVTALLGHFPEYASLTAHADDQRTAVRLANQFRKNGHETMVYPDAAGAYHVNVKQKK
jgi:hypothetical protein